jgi:SRSO17 transposase
MMLVSELIDDTGFLKKRRHSVGVTRLYCRMLASRTTAR